MLPPPNGPKPNDLQKILFAGLKKRMHGAKGFARDRKNKYKVKRTRPSSVVNLEDDALDRMEYDILDRKARRREALAEKRKCRRETRAANQALKSAAKLQRTVRQLLKELPTVVVPVAPPSLAPPRDDPIRPEPPSELAPSPSLDHIAAVLTAAVDAVVVQQQQQQQPPENDWEELTHEDTAAAPPATEATLTAEASVTTPPPPPSPEGENSAAEPPGTFQRLKNWLW